MQLEATESVARGRRAESAFSRKLVNRHNVVAYSGAERQEAGKPAPARLQLHFSLDALPDLPPTALFAGCSPPRRPPSASYCSFRWMRVTTLGARHRITSLGARHLERPASPASPRRPRLPLQPNIPPDVSLRAPIFPPRARTRRCYTGLPAVSPKRGTLWSNSYSS